MHVDPRAGAELALLLPKDVKWHYIGHVQSNKAKPLVRDVPNLFVVETVDSIKIANALNKASGEFRSEKLNVMVQVNTSEEEQKSGIDADGSVELAQHIVSSCEHLNLTGLMTIGRYGDTTSECFDRLVACRKRVAEAIGKAETDLDLSMGMSGDFELAVSLAHGSEVILLLRVVGLMVSFVCAWLDLLWQHARTCGVDHLRCSQLRKQGVEWTGDDDSCSAGYSVLEQIKRQCRLQDKVNVL